MEMTIRTALLSDAEAIALLSAQLGYPASPEQIALRMTQMNAQGGHAVFLACKAQQCLGWVHVFLAFRLESDAFCEIGGLVVDEPYRGRGIGRRLVEQAGVWTSAQGVNRLRVRSNVLRKATHRFYAGLGFQVVKDQSVFEWTL